MNILDVVIQNLTARSRTRKPADSVPFPGGFRGELAHQSRLCTLCGTCAYVCSPGAISLTLGEASGSWAYDAGRCTFCGKCVEYCPTEALSFLQHAAPTVQQRAAAQMAHSVEYQPCARCGSPILPLPHETLVRLYHSEEAAEAAKDAHQLCERCRGRLRGQQLKDGLSGIIR